MDGHFVPNLSMGPPIINSLRKVTRLPLEAHLMISNFHLFVDEFALVGTDLFIVHWERPRHRHKDIWRFCSA